MNRRSASEPAFTDSSRGHVARTQRLSHRMTRRPERVVEEILAMMYSIDKKNEEKVMDRILNTKLERDKLPENTPLPIYLAHREPRNPSPPSRWDKKVSESPQPSVSEDLGLVELIEAAFAAVSAAAASVAATAPGATASTRTASTATASAATASAAAAATASAATATASAATPETAAT